MENGDTFPDFELPNQDNKLIKSSELKGKRIVLFAYPRAMTSGCTKEACSIRDNYSKLSEKGVIIFGISNDPPVKNKKFKDKYDFQYDLLSDEKNDLLAKIGAYGEKKMYGKNYHGTIRKTFIIDEEFKLVKVFNKVKTAIHGEELLEALK